MISPDQTITEAELASLVGVSTRRIRQLAEQNVLERAQRGRYELGASIQALIENAAGNASELQRERIRKLRADADLAELELARGRALVAPIAEMERAWENACATIRANMLGVPQRVIIRIVGETNESTIKAALRDEICTALTSAAKGGHHNNLDEDETNDDNDRTNQPRKRQRGRVPAAAT